MPTVKYPDSPEKTARRHQIEAQQVAEHEQRLERSREQGRIAWDNWDKTGSQNLTVGDRQEIARRLAMLIAKFIDRKKSISKTQLLHGTGLTLKELDRIANPNSSELYAGPTKYRTFIRALAHQTNDDLYALADQILLNTSFHPVSKDDLDEAKLILDALQVAVDRIDQEYKLWEQCKAIATIREPLEKRYIEAVQSCDDEVAMLEIFSQQGDPTIMKWWPLEKLLLAPLEKPVVPDNAFWIRSNPHDPHSKFTVVCDESIFFFPHAYLGPAVEWCDGRPDEYLNDFRWSEMGTETTPIVRFETGEYRIYVQDPKTGKELASGGDFSWGDAVEGMPTTARWLVIYPDHEAQRLVPALFTRGEACFTELVPLTPRLIAEFGDSTRWQCRDNTPNLLQRLRNLTGFSSGKLKIMDDWRETAASFDLNPIFRAHPGEADKINYRRNLEKWIEEGRASLNSPAHS